MESSHGRIVYTKWCENLYTGIYEKCWSCILRHWCVVAFLSAFQWNLRWKGFHEKLLSLSWFLLKFKFLHFSLQFKLLSLSFSCASYAFTQFYGWVWGLKYFFCLFFPTGSHEPKGLKLTLAWKNTLFSQSSNSSLL